MALPETFKHFFDLQKNEGYFKKSDLDYKSQVALLKKYFTKELIVFDLQFGLQGKYSKFTSYKVD